MNKQIYDPIHAFITITPLMQSIIDTSEFQRLRDLKQLGAVHYVYPSATHTRFEHSLGVSHLAGIMAENLTRGEYSLDLPLEKDRFIELVRIAGLIHDIGHGPFSHLYDHQVRRSNEPEHEERGCKIFLDMVLKYNIQLSTPEVNMILNMVNPPKESIHNWQYQIIANKQCQIDVDKIDYIQRDCYHTGLKFGGEWSRLLTNCKIKSTSLGEEITWPEKLQYEILQLFSTRYRLHKQVYNHHTVKAYEYYITEILRSAKNKCDFIDLTDSIVSCRLHKEWRTIQNKISQRNIPKLVGEKTLSKKQTVSGPNPRIVLNIIIDKVTIGFDNGDKNPLNDVWLFNKKNKLTHIDFTMSLSVPTDHREVVLRWYNTDPERQSEAENEWKNYLESL
jgi:HD superfamily phosphohydrolase